MDFFKGVIPIITDPRRMGDGFLNERGIMRGGAVERDYNESPPEMFASPSEMQLVPESEYDARYDEMEATGSGLLHKFLSDFSRTGKPAWRNLDQNGHGYCWAYSTAQAAMLALLASNKDVPRINPHATAAIIKGGRDEGGWCGLSADFARKNGWAVQGTGPGEWPEHARDLRRDTPELRDRMSRYKVAEDWYDVARSVWDQRLSLRQLMTCTFTRTPVGADWMALSHSMGLVQYVRVERGVWWPLVLNSWKGWGWHGLAVLGGPLAVPNNAVGVSSLAA